MKDFRYHVVSLTAVFLALAIGIVLGSGPMHNALIGDMSGQIEDLEAQAEQARAEADSARALTTTAQEFAEESAPTLLAGVLADVSVGTISMADARAEHASGIRDRLVQAGANVGAELTIEPAWTDPDQTAFRSSLASTMAPNVVGVDAESPTPTVLAHALAQALRPGVLPPGATEDDLADTDFPDPNDAQARSALLFDQLLEAQLISGTATDGVHALTLIVGAGDSDEGIRAETAHGLASMATIFTEYTSGVVVAAGPEQEAGIVSAVLNSPDASAAVTTVVEGTEFYGQISVPLALVDALMGNVDHYGPGEGRALVPTPGG